MYNIKTIFTTALTALTLTAASQAAPIVILDPDTVNNPNLAIAVEGIVVNSITYNVSFITTPHSFYDLYDPNQDNDFSDSTTGAAPAFWDDFAAAFSASSQLRTALGDTYIVNPNYYSDSYFMASVGPDTSTFFARIDGSHSPASDFSSAAPGLLKTSVVGQGILTPYVWTIFTPVPEPASLALLSLTALPLIIRRKA
ncbi:hypothetical protein KS4_01990 [Poriferisphaera corsica]|uniref:PEP-CTERM protein-sorting domain-containing protein n=1 Tax=Poriferisphaera corsica TaxID=2528020 RepID=A0A517YPM5_9BACT|nr:hypothetical protein [Poriferisphaera corsica]QDU32170.1 hypothetical protein KS4_01990 [Poriferisphaera corsica]